MPSTWKAPLDSFDYALDFTPVLVAGELIASIISVTSTIQPGGGDSTADIIGTPSPAIANPSVIIWLKGGNLGERHLIQADVQTNSGRNYSGYVNLDILEM